MSISLFRWGGTNFLMNESFSLDVYPTESKVLGERVLSMFIFGTLTDHIQYVEGPLGDGNTTPTTDEPAVKPILESSTVPANGTTTVDVVLTGSDGGVGAFDNVTISTNDTSTAQIIDVNTSIAAANTGTVNDGETAYANLPFGGDTADSGTVTIMTVTLAANAPGTVTLDVNVTGDIAKEFGELYTINTVADGEFTVTKDTLPTLPGLDNSPNDLDDDGSYEDVNGNGEFDIGDVQSIFNALKTEEVQSNTAAFDFNGNSGIDIGDVQALYQAYASS